jgi:TolA-binding protein
VRFNGYQTEREMGRLAPMPTLANGLNELRATWEMEDGASPNEYVRAERRVQDVDALWDQADAAEQNGDLSSHRNLLHKYLEKTVIARDIWFEPKDRQRRRNSAIDKLDALRALDHGSSVARVSAYLSARRSHDAEKSDSEETQRALEQAGTDPNLKDNVAYLKAADIYKRGDYTEAAKAFAEVARRYPQSEKREGAVFMSGVALMKTSSFGPKDEKEDRDNSGADTSSTSQLVLDEAGQQACSIFKKLAKENGRFANDARGWLAYLLLQNHDRVGALVEYYRLLGDKHDENARIEAVVSLQLVRKRATDNEMTRVELALESEPAAALAYAYHNIYNFAIDPGPAYPPYESDDGSEEREKEWKREREDRGRKEMLRVLDFSKRLVGHYPNLAIGGAFALRAAEASLELGDNESAAQFARRAIQSRVVGEERAQALWTNGVAEHRLRHFDVAHKNFATLLSEYPSSRLVEGARRMLAMIAEDSGDIDGALEQYIALDYNLDIAYFVDVLLTPEQLASFIERHADSPKHEELLYALGLRYLRANRWDDARNTLARVKTAITSSYSVYYDDSDCYPIGLEYGCDNPKSGKLDHDNKPIITPALIMRDVQTANDLEGLEEAAERAQGDEAKAEALYQMASYQYEATSLLFYNPVAWTGWRYWNLSELAGGGKYRALNEAQILWRYMQEHETLSRALTIYLKVAQDFPRTRAARDALYTAAVCHDRLSNYNPYWRDIYRNGLHAGVRMVTYADVKATYPNYQLPRGTNSWQPITRTVNGGPGWSAPPKHAPPKPKPTRFARARKVFFEGLLTIERFWDQTARHWTVVTILAIATIFIAGISGYARKVLHGHIVRLRLNDADVDTYPWMQLFQIEPVELGPREQARLFLRGVAQRGWQLVQDRQSRSVLTANVVSHTLLIWLVVALLQTLFAG